MEIGKATAIFKNIDKIVTVDNNPVTESDKIEAINEVVAMPTHNGITKTDVLNALNWAMKYCCFLECQNISLKRVRDFQKNDTERLERRLKHLLQSDFIRSFDEVDVHTKEYKRDIKEADAKILYLCDGNKCKNGYIECKHTTDITHAKNFEYDGYGCYWEQSPNQSESVRENPKNPILSESVRNCPFEDKTQCSYYKQGLCGKCTFSDDKLAWILKNGLFVCPVCGSETDMQYNLCPCCGATLC